MNIPVNYGQVNLIFGGDALPTGAQVTLGFQNVADEDSPTVIASQIGVVLEGCTDIWAATWNEVTLTSLLVKLGPNATGPSAQVANVKVGTYSSSDGIPAASYLVQKTTAMGGRQGKGRMYWPGVPLQDVNEAGVIVPSLRTALQTGMTELFVEMNAAGYPLVLLRHEDSPIQTPEVLTNLSVQSVIATQRRRQRR